MNELTHILWDYACEYRMEGCYTMESRRAKQESEWAARRNMDKLLNEVTPKQKEWLEILWEELHLAQGEDLEAAFVCGLRLGLEL